MKKQTILIIAALFITTLSMTACKSSKGCKGGGWYGDRNLTYTPAQEKGFESTANIKENINDCEEVNP